jgi:ligand-binding sensor domain-containing protein
VEISGYEVANKKSLCSDRVNNLFEDSKKNLWFATEGGLCKLNRGTNDFKRYTTRDGLPSDFILSILEDEKKNLWLATSKVLFAWIRRRNKQLFIQEQMGY